MRNLYALYPDFKIDVAAEQAALAAADRIVLQFPIFWYQVPALLKQWFDDVLAYGTGGDALQGKELLLAASFGAGADDYTPEGRFHTTIPEILKPLEAIQYHTGLKILEPFTITGTLNLTDEDLIASSQAYVERLK